MLTSKQRATLRARANTEDTIFQVGKGGINDNLIKQIDDALNVRELIKLRSLETSPLSAKETAQELAKASHSEVVQVIGTRFVLYRESKENKKIYI